MSSKKNNYMVVLSSNPLSTTVNVSPVFLTGICSLTLNLSSVSRHKIPINVTIRWGDESPDTFTVNNFFPTAGNFNLVDEIMFGADFTIFKKYDHIFSPQINTLQTNLTCQALVGYYDNTICLFKIPVTILSPSFYTSIGDLSIINTNFFDTNESIIYTFITANDSNIIETALYNTTN
jgi:hypothetical protein